MSILEYDEEVEMPEKSIETLYKIAEKYGPDYNVEKICKEVVRDYPEILNK